MNGDIQVHTLVTGQFVENGYILHRKDSRDAVLIDPGAEPETWLAKLDENGLKPRLILATHAHLDHVGAVSDLQQAHDTEFRLHADEVQVLESLDWQCDLFGMPRIPIPRHGAPIADDEPIEVGGIAIRPIATPGHTPGGTCYHVEALDRVFTGDTLFAGTVGRTDLPGGDSKTLVRSLERLCRLLDDDTVALPGHGPATTIGEERTTNPFFRLEK